MMKNKGTVYISCFGCPNLRYEIRRIEILAEQNGFVRVEDSAAADYIVLAGCGIVDYEEKASIKKILDIYNTANKTAKIIVYGCVVTVAEKALKKMGNFITVKFGEEEKFNEIFQGKQKFENIISNVRGYKLHYNPTLNLSINKPLSAEREKQKKLCEDLDRSHKTDLFTEAFEFCTRFTSYGMGKDSCGFGKDIFEIKIGSGCDENCSYCIERMSNGKVKSISAEEILTQIKDGIAQGYRKFYFIHINSAKWGMDTGDDLCNLLDKIAEIAAETPIKLLLPFLYPDKLISSYQRLLPHFLSGLIYCTTVSIQTGSKKIMERMNRKTDLEQFKAVMKDIYAKNVPAYFYTEVIVGFPGETMEDFYTTMAYLQELHFDFMNANPYSVREGTPAAEFTDQIPQEEINRRWAIMRQHFNTLRSQQLLHRITNILDKIEN
jgi:tRNA A37 methylthiotransferase MiaB